MNARLEYTKFFLLILLIIFFGSVVSNLLELELLQGVMGVFMITFGCIKLLGYSAFINSFRKYDFVSKRFVSYAFTFPFVEIILGLSMILISTSLMNIVLSLALIVSLELSISIIYSLYIKQEVQCACLGNIIKLPLSKVSLFEALFGVAVAVILLT